MFLILRYCSLGPYHQIGEPEEALAFQLLPGPVPLSAVIWGMKQRTEDFYLSLLTLSLPITLPAKYVQS